jgi:hypothetical protein
MDRQANNNVKASPYCTNASELDHVPWLKEKIKHHCILFNAAFVQLKISYLHSTLMNVPCGMQGSAMRVSDKGETSDFRCLSASAVYA